MSVHDECGKTLQLYLRVSSFLSRYRTRRVLGLTLVLVISVSAGWVFLAFGQSKIPFHTIWWGGGVGAKRSVVINDQASWSSLWTQTLCHPYWNVTYCPLAPAVNFTSRTVLAVFLGMEPNSGYSINITKVTRIGFGIVVDIRMTQLGANCGAYEVLTYPSHIVDIPKTELPPMFRTETSTVNC